MSCMTSHYMRQSGSLALPSVSARLPSSASSRIGFVQRANSRRHRAVEVQVSQHKSNVVIESIGKFLGRHDPVATGTGALLVTGFCVGHGQPAGEALNIAAFATILGMVLQEALFNGQLDGNNDKPEI